MHVSQATQTDSTLSTRILESVAEARGCSPLDLERPLYDAVDPDALDALFSGESRFGTVQFTYLGYRVTASSDGEVSVNGH